MRITIMAAALCLSAIGLSVATDVAATIRKATNIPAQGLGPALNMLAKERDLHVVYRSEIVGMLKTSGATGEFTADEAFRQLLSGTGLTYRYLDEKTVTIVPIPSSDSASSAHSTPSQATSMQTARAEAENALRLAQAETAHSQARETESFENADRSKSVTSDANASEGRATKTIQEVIVTATKRAERIQDIPMSITAITADDIARRGLVNAADYLRGIPGVNQVDSPFGQSIVIRGLETSPAFQNFSAGTTVATYFGETPTTNSSGLAGSTNIDLKLVDIERVEVLRGPQGTSFGSSSLGGVVRTIPVAPKLEDVEGKVAAGYSVTSGTGGDNYNVQAVGNIPLIKDKLAIRATAYQYQDSGFYRNRAGSDAAFRAAAVIPFGAEAFAVDEDEVGSYYVLGGRITALFKAGDALKFTLGYLTQESETDGYALQNSGPYEHTMLQVAPAHALRGQKGGLTDMDIDIANATLEYDFGWAALLATVSHLDGATTYVQPYSFYGNDPAVAYPVSALGGSEHREKVGELRLTTQFGGAWNFLAGLYAEELDDDYMDDSRWHGSPASNFFGAEVLGGNIQAYELKQKAAFGEASWEFMPGFTLTGGARAYDYQRTGQTQRTGLLGDGSITDLEGDASGASFRGNLSHKFNDNALFYAGWSQGFRLGKPQPGLPPGLCDEDGDGIVDGTDDITISQTRSVASDEVDSYELGSKVSLLDRRLIIAADIYRVEWDEIPVRVLAPREPGCGRAYNANAGSARSEGVELQANLYVTEAFRVDIGASGIRARLTKDAPGLNPPAFKGDRLPGSPEFNANLALQYEFNLGGSNAFIRADSIYIGSFYGDLQKSTHTKAGDYVKLDATARVAINDLNIDLFVRNLTNADEFAFRDTSSFVEFYGYRLRPRTIGLQLSVDF